MSESPMSPLVPHAVFSQLDEVGGLRPVGRHDFTHKITAGVANSGDVFSVGGVECVDMTNQLHIVACDDYLAALLAPLSRTCRSFGSHQHVH